MISDIICLKVMRKHLVHMTQGNTRECLRTRAKRGRKPKKLEDHEPENVPEIPNGHAIDVDRGRASSFKRAVRCTPERCKLFNDTEDEITPSRIWMKTTSIHFLRLFFAAKFS